MAGIFGTIAAGIERKSVDISALTWERLLGNVPARSGVAVNIDSALRVSTVLACARVLANGIAQIPLKVYRDRPGGGQDVATDHPAHRLLSRQPNGWMTSFDVRRLMMFHAVLNGNAYAYLGWGGVPRRLVEIVPLMPGAVSVRAGMNYEPIYSVADHGGAMRDVPRENIFHLCGPSWNGIAGINAIETAREAIGLAIATEESHSRLHANGAKPGGLLSVDGKLDKDGRERLKAGLAANVEGLQNAFRTLVLDQSAKWTPFAMTGVDAQHLATRQFQIEEICRDLGVFPQMVGYADKTATFASAEQFFLAHVVHSLGPWIENWQQALNQSIFGNEPDMSAEFSVQGLLRGDHKTRAEFYAAGIVNGYFSRNEVRGWESLNPVDGLDEMLIPLNMGTQSERDAMAKGVAEAVKSMIGHNGGPALDEGELEMKIGRVLSAANERRIVGARDGLNEVLESLSGVAS
jgi:HK97 family phage portal protein